MEIDKLYLAIIAFIAIGIIVNFVVALAPARFSWLRWSGFLAAATGLGFGIYAADPLLSESGLNLNIYLVWAATLILLIALVGALGWTVTNSFLVPIMADTARYLSPRPKDVALARKIRENGVRMLESLHASEKYDRIIVIAHSLGSIIGLDIMSRLWARRSERMTPDQRVAYETTLSECVLIQHKIATAIDSAVLHLDDALAGRDPDPADRKTARHGNGENNHHALGDLKSALQRVVRLKSRNRAARKIGERIHQLEAEGGGALGDISDALNAYAASFDQMGGQKNQNIAASLSFAADDLAQAANDLKRYRSFSENLKYELSQRSATGDRSPVWLISDFITIGSPLTYGAWLLTRQRQKEYPKTGWASSMLMTADPDGQADPALITADNRTFDLLPCRWTNLFFKTRYVVIGDIIGGPLWQNFGIGVEDIALSGRRPNFRYFAHNEYWKLDPDWFAWLKESQIQGDDFPEHVRQLRGALRLEL